MYFLHGWPKSYTVPLKPEPIISIKLSPDHTYIAVLTASTLYIWSGDQHRILLGYYLRTALLITRDGENEDIYWRPSGHLALTTHNGRIYFVDLFVDEQGPDLLKHPMEADDGISRRFAPKMPVRLVLRGTFLVSNTGVAWLYESNTKLHVCTHDGYLQRWSPTRDQFHLDEELPVYSLSPVPLRVLMNQKQPQTSEHMHRQASNSDLPKSQSAQTLNGESTAPPISPKDTAALLEEAIEDLSVTSIDYCSNMRILLVAFQGGAAAVLHGKLDGPLNELKLIWLPIQGATVVAINSRKKLLSVGLENGDVLLFDVDQQLRLHKTLSLNPWGITKRITGAARCLNWSPDGRILAVGYAARGFSTWSSNGCRLNCSISQTNIMLSEQTTSFMASVHLRTRRKSRDRSASKNASPPTSTPSSAHSTSSSIPRVDDDVHHGVESAPPSPTPSHSNLQVTKVTEAAFHGVNAMSWGYDGYFLLLASNGPATTHGIIEQFQFMKACIAANFNMNYCQRILLQGADRLLLLVNRGYELGDLSWKHLIPPSVYLQDSWPLRLVSVSPDGTYIAVGGQKGFVLLNAVSMGAWSLFGDRIEEQSIRCIGIAWYKHYLVTAVWCEPLKTHQVMFFPRNQKLSFSSLAFRANVPQNKTPTFIDCNDNYLVLFTTDAYFQYRIFVDDTPQKKVSLKLTHQLGIDTPFDATSVLLLPSNVVMGDTMKKEVNEPLTAVAVGSGLSPSPSASSIDSNDLPEKSPSKQESEKAKTQVRTMSKTMAKFIVLDTNGNLSLTNAERSIQMDLSRGIEQFWMANTDVSDLGNSLWAYGERGLEVWFPFFTHSASEMHKQNYLTRERSLDFDLEVVPIGFLPQWGLIVGVGQGPIRSHSTTSPCFSYETKTQPFLHSVLKRMLEKGEVAHAVDMAKHYTAISHFQHTLELLLHEALEAQHSADSKRAKSKPSNGSESSKPSETTEEADGQTSSRTSLEIVDSAPLNTSAASLSTPMKPIVPLLTTATSSGTLPHLTPSALGQSSAQLAQTASSASQSRRPKGKDSTKQTLLRYVFDFLREFGAQLYTTVVVACARKTDPALWRTLFHPRYSAGKPRALFEQCLSMGKLAVASSYLRVIQFMEGEAESRRAALQCLDLCLKLDDLELLRDLMRFLEPNVMASPHQSSDRIGAEQGQTKSLNNSSASLSASTSSSALSVTLSPPGTEQLRKEVEGHTTGGYNEQQEQFVLDDTLARYARKLLSNQEMRALIRFARITRHSLSDWISRERKRAAIIEDYPAALSKIHAQFTIPRPTHFPVAHLSFDAEHSMHDYSAIYFPNSDYLLKVEEEEEDDTLQALDLASYGPQVYDSLHDTSTAQTFKDLEYLLQELMIADCAGWALVIATVLFRVPTLESVLDTHPIFWHVFKPMLEAEHSKGYQDLLQYLIQRPKQ